jgi:hypothetical protein
LAPKLLTKNSKNDNFKANLRLVLK